MIAVIGDIHGCFFTLKELVERIRRNYPGVPIYCVGDLIDRGNFSFETIEFIISEGLTTTSGNHDFMFYYFITDPTNEIGRSWLFNGYESTQASYSAHQDKVIEHLNFINTLPLYINLEDCFISHAGISSFFRNKFPTNPFMDNDKFHDIVKKNKDNEHGIIWNREQLMNLGKLQIVGHTRQNKIVYQKFNNAVYIDTSVYTGNKLTCIMVEAGKIVDSFSVGTFPEDIGNSKPII